MKALIIVLLICLSGYAQETGDLRYTDKLEIYLDYSILSYMVGVADTVTGQTAYVYYDGTMRGWFDFDSLYQTRNKDGYVYLGDMVAINLNTIQSERKRFKIFMEEYNGWVMLPTHDYKCERMLNTAEREISRLKDAIESKDLEIELYKGVIESSKQAFIKLKALWDLRKEFNK